MTYIEFFEQDAVENICACLAQAPDRVILVGDGTKAEQRHAQRYQALLAARGFSTEFICRKADRNNLNSITELLTELVEECGDCAFGLTGGSDLCLVAMGVVFERFRDRNIQMHRFNIRSGVITDCDQDGRLLFERAVPRLSVEENIRLYGGDVVYADQKPGATPRLEWTDSLYDDVDAVWSVCREAGREWNWVLQTLYAAQSRGRTEGLTTEVDAARLAELPGADLALNPKRTILRRLRGAGLLTECSRRNGVFRITYRSEQVRHCLSKAGQALELKICSAARRTLDETGQPVYNDVMTGVSIDWDGKLHEGDAVHDTANEIDVLMMRGMVPVFVSCKNGEVSVDELYKLNTVAARFGGKYAKRVLVAPALGESGRPAAESIRQRAADMGIQLLESVARMTDAQLQRRLGTLWCS